MDLHKNARLSLRSREALVRKVIEEKQTLKAAAAAFSVSRLVPQVRALPLGANLGLP